MFTWSSLFSTFPQFSSNNRRYLLFPGSPAPSPLPRLTESASPLSQTHPGIKRMSFYIQVQYSTKGDVENHFPIWRVLSQSKRRPSVLLSPRFKECILTNPNFRYEEIFLTVWTLIYHLSQRINIQEHKRHFIFSIWILINQKCSCRIVQQFTWLSLNRIWDLAESSSKESFRIFWFRQKLFREEVHRQAGLRSPPQ